MAVASRAAVHLQDEQFRRRGESVDHFGQALEIRIGSSCQDQNCCVPLDIPGHMFYQ